MKILRYVLLNLIPGLAMMTVGLYCLTHITQQTNFLPMKPSTFFFCVAAIAVISLGVIGCISENRPTAEFAVLIDETDSSFAVPDAKQVITTIGLDTDMWTGVNFNLARITDVSYVPHSRIVLSKGGNRLASNQYARKREMATFEMKLTELLDSVKNDEPGKPNSSVFFPLVNELVRLASSEADKKMLIVYSDLRENRPSLSFYDPETFALLQSDPGKIETKLFAEAKLPDVTGIEVLLIYHPRNAEDDATFRVVSGFYKTLLESKGAKVTISASLVSQ